jgi:hypothetical protein
MVWVINNILILINIHIFSLHLSVLLVLEIFLVLVFLLNQPN